MTKIEVSTLKEEYPWMMEHAERLVRLASIYTWELDDLEYAETAKASLMHDVVEDTQYSIGDVVDTFGEGELAEAVELLTRDESTTYAEYVQRIIESESALAIRVKILDMLDHLHPALIAGLEPRLQRRYLEFLPALLDAYRTIQDETGHGKRNA